MTPYNQLAMYKCKSVCVCVCVFGRREGCLFYDPYPLILAILLSLHLVTFSMFSLLLVIWFFLLKFAIYHGAAADDPHRLLLGNLTKDLCGPYQEVNIACTCCPYIQSIPTLTLRHKTISFSDILAACSHSPLYLTSNQMTLPTALVGRAHQSASL